MQNLKTRALALLNRGIDKLQETFPPNRLALLVAAPLAIAAGALNAYVAVHFPGLPQFSNAQVAGAFGVAFISIVALAYKFIDGVQYDEARKHHAIEAERQRKSDEKIAAIKAG